MLENDQPDVPPYAGPEDGLQIRDYINFVNITSECFTILLLCCT